jgi:hypothetical protein
VDYGRNLIHHGTFSKGDTATMPQPDSFRSPAYPVLIDFSMRVGGESHYLQWLVYTQALLSALLVPLTICIYFTPIYTWFLRRGRDMGFLSDRNSIFVPCGR